MYFYDLQRVDLIMFKSATLSTVCSCEMFVIKISAELLNASCSFDLQRQFNKTTFSVKNLPFINFPKQNSSIIYHRVLFFVKVEFSF